MKYILGNLVLLNFSNSGLALGEPMPEQGFPSEIHLASQIDLSVLDHWFFIVPMGQGIHGSKLRSDNFKVTSGQEFGIMIRFLSSDKQLHQEVRLTVPDHPETFTCPKCKSGELQVGEDGKTVIVRSEINAERGISGFYWGVDERDARGRYHMEIYLNELLVASHDFEVI